MDLQDYFIITLILACMYGALWFAASEEKIVDFINRTVWKIKRYLKGKRHPIIKK